MAAMIVYLGELWLWIGAGVAALFLTVGIDRIDEDAQGAYVFRPLLIPGILLIWPLVIWRWVQIERQGEVTFNRYRPVRKSHHVVSFVMAICILGLLSFGWMARQDWPADVAPVQLSQGDAG